MGLVLKFVVVAAGDVDFASHDGFYRGMLICVFKEFLYSVHIAMVRNGQTRHTQFLCSFEQIVY